MDSKKIFDELNPLAPGLMMGPSSLRLAMEVLENIHLAPGARIFDLACGQGLSTMYLAKKYPQAQIIAGDFWISPEDNMKLFRSQGLDSQILPLRTEVPHLPFAPESFDLILCLDAFQYFGANETAFPQVLGPLLKPQGRFLMAVPGFHQEGIPETLKEFIKEEYEFHSPEWWTHLFKKFPGYEIRRTWPLACHDLAWQDWLACDNPHAIGDRPMIKADTTKALCLVGMEVQKA